MHNNVKFVLRDEDIQVNIIRQLVFRFILGVGVCAIQRVLGMEESKKLSPTRLRISSGTILMPCSLSVDYATFGDLYYCTLNRSAK